MEMELSNCYDVLEIRPDATLKDVEEAYKKACWLYSDQNPDLDHFFTKDEAKEFRAVLNEAYRILTASLQPSAEPKTDKSYQDRLPPKFYYNSSYSPSASSSNSLSTPASASSTASVPAVEEDFDTELVQLEQEIDPGLESELLKHSFYDGLILKKLRLKQKISLNYIAAKTNIGVHHLKAIEANNFPVLPAGVFVKSYVKQYAEILGLDAKTVGASYIRLFNESKQAL